MEAVTISQDLLNYVFHNRHQILRVHSIFSQAINLIDEQNTLVTLLSVPGDIGPMCVTLSHFSREKQAIQIDDPVEIVTDGLFFKRSHLRLSFNRATLWNPSADVNGSVKTGKEQNEDLGIISSKLLSVGDGTGISGLLKVMPVQFGGPMNRLAIEALNPYCRFIHEPLIHLLEALAKDDYGAASALLPQFIGFGPGLTPSTDDFLVGIMITLYYDALLNPFGKANVHSFLETIGQTCRGRTTVVSESMLKQASKGIVTEGYRRLIKRILFNDSDDINVAINQVILKGASSGLDFLFGFYCMNRIRLNKATKED